MPEFNLAVPKDNPVFVITRRFLASRELVWDCFTQPEHMMHFWGPHGSSTPVCEIDLRPGGTWRTVIRFADGQEFAYASIFTSIERPSAFSYRDAPYDWQGGLDGLAPPELDTILALEEASGTTLMTLTVRCTDIAFRDAQIASGFGDMVKAGTDRLESYLETLNGGAASRAQPTIPEGAES